MERPIFVFAQPRSGSTLLQRLLNSIDEACIYGEHLGILKGVADSYLGFMNHRNRANFCSEVPNDDSFKMHISKVLRNSGAFIAGANGLTQEQVRTAYKGFLRTLLHPLSDPKIHRWGFKEIRYGVGDSVFEMLLELFPDASFIFLVRNPDDVLQSIEATGWWDTSFDENLQNWISQAINFQKSHLAHPQSTILIKYEDLIDWSSKAAYRLFDWLDFKLTSRQADILFKMPKIGAAERKPSLTYDAQNKIRSACSRPEISRLYPACVATS